MIQFGVMESVRPTCIQFVCHVTTPYRFDQHVEDEVCERGGWFQKTRNNYQLDAMR